MQKSHYLLTLKLCAVHDEQLRDFFVPQRDGLMKWCLTKLVGGIKLGASLRQERSHHAYLAINGGNVKGRKARTRFRVDVCTCPKKQLRYLSMPFTARPVESCVPLGRGGV
jgi:hypothetical protein